MIKDLDKKRKRKTFGKNFALQAFGILFLIGILILITANFRMYQRRRELIRQIETYEKQIEDINKSNQTIKEEIANSDDVDYLEKLAYEQFNQAKPGETEYIFIKPGSKIESSETSLSSKSWISWLSNVWGWIKEKF